MRSSLINQVRTSPIVSIFFWVLTLYRVKRSRSHWSNSASLSLRKSYFPMVRVDGAVTESLKLGDLLASSGDKTKAVDAYLEAFRIAPHVFQGKHVKTFDEQNRLKDLVDLFTVERLSQTRSVSDQLPLLTRTDEG